jgi:hypothetical protein
MTPLTRCRPGWLAAGARITAPCDPGLAVQVQDDRQPAVRFHEADTLTHLGDTRHAAGELAQAREDWQQALTILEDLQHPDADQVRAKLATADAH